MDREKVIKELHDARRYLEDKEWSDRGASPHIDAINDALAILKEQKAIVRCKDCIWFHKPDEGTGKQCKCNYHGGATKEDRYCWWGEKDG